MQTAQNYIAETAHFIERALGRMEAGERPSAPKEIMLYVEELLSAKELQVCDTATD